MSTTEPTYRLSCPRRFAYGVGHVLNDMCASMWFSYLLVFFHNVMEFSNEMAGYLMLLGQIADALATPLIGYESDRTSGCCNYTKRKSWHLLGTLCVGLTFIFLFMSCLGCDTAEVWAKFIYYAPFVVIFQFGWAATQIAHLSLIPELTPNESERVELNAIRYAFTVMSNLAVYVIAWLLFNSAQEQNIGPYDLPQFRTLAMVVVGTGAVFSLLFHLGVQEPNYIVPPPSVKYLAVTEEPVVPTVMVWRSWLSEVQFYQISALYMCTRLVVNLTQIYLPMFLTDSLMLDKQYIAIVPLVVYISGFVMAFLMNPVNRCVGRKVTYLLGLMFIAGACVWLWFVSAQMEAQIFGPAILLGAGGSTILVTSLAMTADLIGRHTNSGAFVYGAMSFTDKLSSGIAVLFIQNLHPCKTQACCPACVWYYRDMMVLTPGGVAIVAFIILLTLAPVTIGKLRIDTGLAIEDNDDSEHEPLLPEDTSTNAEDCCSYFCCLRTSRDVEARVLACGCRKQQCTHHKAPTMYGSTIVHQTDTLAAPSTNERGDLLINADHFEEDGSNNDVSYSAETNAHGTPNIRSGTPSGPDLASTHPTLTNPTDAHTVSADVHSYLSASPQIA